MNGARIVERRDQRLHEARRPVRGFQVGPAFQAVRRGQMPLALRGGLVEIATEMDAEFCLGDGLHEAEGRRRIVGGIAAEYKEVFDLPGVEVADEIGQRSRHRQLLSRLEMVDRRRELRIDPMTKRMDVSWKRRAGDDERSAAMSRDIARDFVAERGGLPGQIRFRQIGAEPSRDGDRHRSDLSGRNDQPMIGIGAGEGRRSLDRVEPADFRAVLARAAPRGETARVDDLHRAGSKRVRVERNHDLGVAEPRNRQHGAAESGDGAVMGGRIEQRIVDVPLQGGKSSAEKPDLPRQSRRADRARQQPQSFAVAGDQRFEPWFDGVEERRPIADFDRRFSTLGSGRDHRARERRLRRRRRSSRGWRDAADCLRS